MLIVTNNPKVKESESNVLWVEGSYYDVLEKVKELIINDKYQLLSHPLSGSIKPNETYYKSIMLDDSEYKYSDLDSLEFIEQAIEVYNKFIACQKRPNWSVEILNDFAHVDYFLIQSAIQSTITYKK